MSALVKSRHFAAPSLCPLYPRKRTLINARRMSAKGQKRTFNENPVPKCSAILRLETIGGSMRAEGATAFARWPFWLNCRFERVDVRQFSN
jgi:hypothetical protein